LEAYLADLLWEIRCVHFILDNGSSHIATVTREWVAAQEGLVRFHFIPAHASWLNQAEMALSAFSRRYLRDRERKPSRIDHPSLSLATRVQSGARTSISVVLHQARYARMYSRRTWATVP